MNMEKKYPLVFLACAMLIVAVLVIPMNGVIAQSDNKKNIQWCCSYIEEEKNNLHTMVIMTTGSNSYI